MTSPLTSVPAIAVPPGADPLETLLREIDRQVHMDGWDGPATYHMLRHHTLGIGVGEFDFGPVADAIGQMYPPEALTVLRVAISRNPRVVPSGFVGWVNTFEGWGITHDVRDAEATAQAHEDAQARRIHQRPDRVETRQSLVVLANGREGMLTRERGTGGADDTFHYLPQVGEGLVVDALRKLVTICAAVTR